VATRHRAIYEAAHEARRLMGDAARELRVARVLSGQTQASIARRLGVSQSRVCRVEHGQVAGVSVDELARHASAVGLRLFVRLYPGGRRPLDAPQLQLLTRLRERCSPQWTWQTEMPMPMEGDLRAADGVLSGPCTVVVEAITRFADFQAQSRAALLKKRDLSAKRLILLVASTTTNRHILRGAGDVAHAAFPLPTKTVLAALEAGRDPGGDGIVLL
jgi:transcriptional regulator with XRE-family HTH domain